MTGQANLGAGTGGVNATGAAIDEGGRMITGGVAESGGFVFDLALAQFNARDLRDHTRSEAKLVASGECVQAATGRDVCAVRYKVAEAH